MPSGTLVAFLAVLTPLAAVLAIVIYVGAMRAVWRRQGRWLGWRAFHAQQYSLSGSGNARTPNGNGKGGDGLLRPVIHEVWLDVNELERSLYSLRLGTERARETQDDNEDDGASQDQEPKTSAIADGEMQRIGLLRDNILVSGSRPT
jgi:hypothetical protein